MFQPLSCCHEGTPIARTNLLFPGTSGDKPFQASLLSPNWTVTRDKHLLSGYKRRAVCKLFLLDFSPFCTSAIWRSPLRQLGMHFLLWWDPLVAVLVLKMESCSVEPLAAVSGLNNSLRKALQSWHPILFVNLRHCEAHSSMECADMCFCNHLLCDRVRIR